MPSTQNVVPETAETEAGTNPAGTGPSVGAFAGADGDDACVGDGDVAANDVRCDVGTVAELGVPTGTVVVEVAVEELFAGVLVVIAAELAGRPLGGVLEATFPLVDPQAASASSAVPPAATTADVVCSPDRFMPEQTRNPRVGLSLAEVMLRCAAART